MKGLSKRIFFWTLVVLFFVTTPLVIFYALGYRFNPERGIFVYTGSISIKSNPLNVEIYIDNELKTKSLSRINNSYHIGGIKPGEHLIGVKTPGFNSWEKKITVNSGTSTEFWNVLLIKNEYEKTPYPAPGIKKLFFDPGKKMIAYVKNKENGLAVDILDVDNNETESVFDSEEYGFTSDEKENIEWAPQSKKIIIPAENNLGKSYFIVDIKTKEVIDLEKILQKEKISRVRWDQDNKNYIYYISENNLYHAKIDDPEDNLLIAKDISSYDISSNDIYYFQLSNGIVYRTNSDGSINPQQITTSAPNKIDDLGYQITVYDKDRIAMLNKKGDLYIYNFGKKEEYFDNLASGIKEIQFSDDGKKMLFYSDYEICVYYTRDWEVQPWRSENEKKEILRFSEKIDNVQWSRDYEHIIFNVGNEIKITEIDNRSQNNISDIISLEFESPEIVSDLGEEKIYFTNEEGGELNLFSINFPEKIGIPYLNY